MYRRKRVGPNIEPCGTPQRTGEGEEEIDWNCTYWDLFVK